MEKEVEVFQVQEEVVNVNLLKEISRLKSRLEALESFVLNKYGSEALDEFDSSSKERYTAVNPNGSAGATGEYITVQFATTSNADEFPTNFINSGSTEKPQQIEIQMQNSGDLIFAQKSCPTTLNDLSMSSSTYSIIENEKKFNCSTCSRKFKRLHNLKEHAKTHQSSSLTTTYNIIPVQIIDPIDGNTQITFPPSIDPLRQHQCGICFKTYKRRGHVNQHIKLAHTDDKRFKCVRCDKAYGQNSMLVQHLKRCSGAIKRFACNQCEKRFLTNPELTKHKRIHTGEKPYSCRVCSKSFAIKSNVVTHMRIHTGEKPVHCHICKKGFSRKEVLEKHLKIHTLEKKFQCKDCSEKFLRKYHLDKHWNEVHKTKYNFTPEELESITLPVLGQKENNKSEKSDPIRNNKKKKQKQKV